MKFLFASDIHGSYKYLKMLLAKFDESRADRLVLLGDLYYHGPRNPLPEGYDPAACFTALNARRDQLLVIQGNCDAEVDQMVSEFPFEKSAEIKTDGLVLSLIHGHQTETQTVIAGSADVILYGHFHVARMEKNSDGPWMMSPGSVSLPKEESIRGYIIYENRRFELFDLLTGKSVKSVLVQP